MGLWSRGFGQVVHNSLPGVFWRFRYGLEIAHCGPMFQSYHLDQGAGRRGELSKFVAIENNVIS